MSIDSKSKRAGPIASLADIRHRFLILVFPALFGTFHLRSSLSVFILARLTSFAHLSQVTTEDCLCPIGLNLKRVRKQINLAKEETSAQQTTLAQLDYLFDAQLHINHLSKLIPFAFISCIF
jgi:hypothetical protein